MTAFPHHRRTLLLAAGFYAVLALLCTQVPLLDHPGFEFAFVFAVVGPLVAGRITIGMAAPRYRAGDPDQPFRVVPEVFRLTGISLALLLIPLAVILLNGLRVPLCDVGEGLMFFLLLPVTGVIFAVTWALFCTVHYRWPTFAFALFYLLTIAYALYLGYATPAIFSYNLFYGYFPGLTYDELLPLEWPLLLFRLFTLSLAGVLIGLTAIIARHADPSDGLLRKAVMLVRVLWGDYRTIAVAMILLWMLAVLLRCEARWETTATYIEERLGGKFVTKNFTVVYDSSTTSATEAYRLAMEHEFQLSRIKEIFVLPRVGHITSFVYPSAEAKRRFIGAGATELAKPWSRQVHITRQNVDATLKHELVHVIAAPFGMPVIHANTSPGLTEGLAIAVEGEWGGRTLAEHASLLRRAGMVPSIEQMLGPTGFIAQSSSVSYVLAGAFAEHLIKRYGMRQFLLLYGTTSYEDVYGQPLSALIAAWQRSVDSAGVQPSDTAVVDVLFRRPPLIGKVCVRLYARRLREAQRLVADGQYDEALSRYHALAAVGGYDAIAGLINLHVRRQEYHRVLDMYDSLLTHAPRPTRYLPLAIVAGDAAWALDNPVLARSLYESVRGARVTPSLTETAAVRLLALADTVGGAAFRNFFQSQAPDAARSAMLAKPSTLPADSLRWYLRGKVHYRMGRFDEARSLFMRATFISTDPLLEAARCMALGDATLRMGQFQEARAAYWSALNYDGRAAAAIEIDERIARCEFLEQPQ
jgi:tetratricopeptide (TPR) repeat protein